jgi:hypothetical protein
LPLDGIAAAVKTSEHRDIVIRFDYEHQRVGKAPQEGAADVPVNDRELSGIGDDAIDCSINGLKEKLSKTRRPAFVPIACFDELLAGEGVKMTVRTIS